jgi:formiminoglutamase
VTEDPLWPRASTLLVEPDASRVGLVGVPLSRGSISPSQAHRTPAAVRDALRRLPTFHAGLGVDLPELADCGDLDVAELTGTDAVAAVRQALTALPSYELLLLLGGDNLVTWPAVQALSPDLSRVGLLTLDAHHDVRGFHAGATNGTPVRGLVDAGLQHVTQVGIADLTNSRGHRQWCEDHGVRVVPADACRGRVGVVVREELDRLAEQCDLLYVDLDVDVVDRAFVPGCPGARPGGLLPHELLQAAVEAGRHPKVRGIDVVEVDAAADVNEVTVQLAAMCLLSAAAGFAAR